jgi:Cu/Ag efflux protein CusF
VTIVFENTDRVRHDLMLPGLDPMLAINLLGPARQEASFVTPDEDVTLVYHCHVSTHERHGMLGLLVVGKGSALAPGQAEGIVPGAIAAAESAGAAGAPAAGGMTMGAVGDAATAASVFQGTGTVVATVPRTRQLVIAGDAIPGYMAPMTMGYAVASPALLEGLKPPDRIGFTIDAKTNTITALEVLQRGP